MLVYVIIIIHNEYLLNLVDNGVVSKLLVVLCVMHNR